MVSEDVAARLAIPEAVLSAMTREGIVQPLGAPRANSSKHYYGPYIAELRSDFGFLDQAERYKTHFWAARSARATSTDSFGPPLIASWKSFPADMTASPVRPEVIRKALLIDPVVGIGVAQELLGFLQHEVRILVRAKNLRVIGGTDSAWRHKRFLLQDLLEIYFNPKIVDRCERVISDYWRKKNSRSRINVS